MYLISAYFDKNTNRILNRYIEMIAKESGNCFMVEHHVPPHMTISQIEARNTDVLMPSMELLKTRLYKGNIEICSVGMLLPYVLYAMPVLNQYLQDSINIVHDAFYDIPETNIYKYYKPMSWFPHITLGKTLTKEQMQCAVRVMQEHFVPLTATVTEIGLAKVNPHEDVMRFSLFDTTQTEIYFDDK
ncbi:MAG: hypothetical protein ACI4EK_02760 [Wujia sp.]